MAHLLEVLVSPWYCGEKQVLYCRRHLQISSELIVQNIGFLMPSMATSFCKVFSTLSNTALHQHLFKLPGFFVCQKVHTGVHRVTGLSGIGVHLRQQGATSANASTKPIVSHSLLSYSCTSSVECWSSNLTQCWGSFLSSALLSPSLWYPLTKAVWVLYLF